MWTIIISFLIMSFIAIRLGGWFGVGIIALFLLYAWANARIGKKPGSVVRFIERLGVDDDDLISK